MRNSFLCALVLIMSFAFALAANSGSSQPAPGAASNSESSADADASFSALLLAKEKSLPEAQKRKDIEFFKNITTDDFLEVGADAKVYTRNEMLEGLNSADLQNYSIYDPKVIRLNDNAAVVTYDAIVQMTIGDERAPRYQHVSSVWVNQGGKWLLKFQQSTAAQ